jgi:hypothetical protein
MYGFAKSPAALPWSHVAERLERAHNYWIATVRPSGRPHVTPVWGVWVEGALYIDGPPVAQWAKNIARNPSISVHLESGEDVVILEGVVEDLVTDAELGARIVTAWDGKYGRFHPQPATSGILRLRPRTARAWSDSTLEDGTRWDFTP